MHGPKKRAGGVAAIEGVRTPAKVAQLVADETDHHLLVGKGAQDFARAMGFKIEEGLINDNARKQWLEWKRRTDPLHYLDPEEPRAGVVRRRAADGARRADRRPRHFWGTINCDGVNAKGEICGVTTTSGLAWKIPGRAGDSPILGAGLYVDGDVGAAGSTGRGEANLYNLSSFLIVEEMRRGAHPKDAAMTALKRVAKNTIEKRLLNAKGQPELRPQLLLPEREGRVRRRGDVRIDLRGLHGERSADAADGRALRGSPNGLNAIAERRHHDQKTEPPRFRSCHDRCDRCGRRDSENVVR